MAAQGLLSLGGMDSDPIGELSFRHAPFGKCQHFGDDVGIGRLEVATIGTEEGDRGEEADALVAIPIRVILDEPEGVRRR